MNITILDSWLRDYIDTNAAPLDIASALSLHSFGIEKITPTAGGDTLYEVEITPNRSDAISVIGVARELLVVLPKHGFSCSWRKQPVISQEINSTKYSLKVDIRDPSLVPCFYAIVLDNVTIGPGPDSMAKRLEESGFRGINNIVDITNYLMLDKGQPMHSFDYDKIIGQTMIVRESLSGEKITTLDGVERTLPSGVIVIEDGSGRLIDLCGIMGAKNSEVDEKTKRVLLFVQVYDPIRIRKASMTLGHRTDAALRFEKGIDYGGVVPALWEAVDMAKKYAGATVESSLVSIVNQEISEKFVKIDYPRIDQVAGIHLDKSIVDQTLTDLGFKIDEDKCLVPSWRYDDINITEDLAEEVIRVYGYYNIKGDLPSGEIPDSRESSCFFWEDVARDYLKYMGFNECYTYSATTAKKAGADALAISNPLNEDVSHLRTSLIPQLLSVLERNQGYSSTLKLYELSATYHPSENDIPLQPITLGVVVKGLNYREFKGYIEGLFLEMGIKNPPDFSINSHSDNILTFEINFENLVTLSTKTKTYTPLTGFNSIREDLTFTIHSGVTYQKIVSVIKESDEKIINLQLKDVFKDSLTISIEYLDRKKQISSTDTQEIRQKIFSNLEKKLSIRLKGV